MAALLHGGMVGTHAGDRLGMAVKMAHGSCTDVPPARKWATHGRQPWLAKKFPIAPQHPERVCWGRDRYCCAKDMRCGNGSDRTQHPVELFGEDRQEWEGPAGESSGGPGAAVEVEQAALQTVSAPQPLPPA